MAKTQQVQYKYTGGIVDAVRGSVGPLIQAVIDSKAEIKVGQGKDHDNIYLQRIINNAIRDLVNIVTDPNKSQNAIKNVVRSYGLKKGAEKLNELGLDIDPKEVKSISDLLTDENIIALGKNVGGQLSGLGEYHKQEGKLPSFLALLRNSYMPSKIEDGKAIYDPIVPGSRKDYISEDDELDAVDNPNLSTKGRIPQDEVFSEKEINTIGSMLAERDRDKVHGINPKMPIGEFNFEDNYSHTKKDFQNAIENDLRDNPDLNIIGSGTEGRGYLPGKEITDAMRDTFGLGYYGTYDPVTGEWQPGVPDESGNYIVKDTYNWNRGRPSGIMKILNMMNNPANLTNQTAVEGVTHPTGPSSRAREGQEIEITVPTYQNDPMGHMDLIDRRGLENSGGMPGMYWQDEAFSTDDTSSGTEDQGYTSLDIGYRRGGQISQGLDNLYMNKRDSKQKLNNMMGFQERQYGGGLDDAYMNRRRSNAFADPNANTAFDSPMSIGGLPTVYRQDGGDMDFMSTYTQEDIDEAMAPDPPEAEFGAGQYVPPQRGDPLLPFNAPPKGSYVNPPDTPFRSFSPNRLTYEAQQKVNRETQGRTPAEMDYRVGMPQLAYPSQAIIDDDILNMRLAAQNKIDEEKREQANKPDQTSAVSLYLHNIANLGKTFGATAIPPSALYKAVETPTGAASLLSAIGKGDFGNRALNLAPPQELIDKANQLNRKSGGGLSTIYRDNGGLTDPGGDNFMSSNLSDPSDPNDWNDQANWAKTGLLNTPAPPAPSAPSTRDDEPPSWTPAAGRDTEGYLSTPLPSGLYEMSPRSESMIRDTLSETFGNRSEEIFNRMSDQQKRNFESAYHGKNLFGDTGADDFSKGYRYGGARGTLLDILEQAAMDKYGIGDFIRDDAATRKEDRDLDLVDSDAGDGVSKDDLNERGLTDDVINLFTSFFSAGKAEEMSPRTIMSINNTLKDSGATYSPPDGGGAIGGLINLGAPFPLKLAFNAATRNSRGSITTRDGTTFNIGKDGRFTFSPDSLPLPDIDYNDPPQTRQPRPVEKKKAAPKIEEKKATTEKTSNLPSIKESNIERLKTYMSLTGKDLSDSKQDLAITDISITEEDFT